MFLKVLLLYSCNLHGTRSFLGLWWIFQWSWNFLLWNLKVHILLKATSATVSYTIVNKTSCSSGPHTVPKILLQRSNYHHSFALCPAFNILFFKFSSVYWHRRFFLLSPKKVLSNHLIFVKFLYHLLFSPLSLSFMKRPNLMNTFYWVSAELKRLYSSSVGK
jgi:hypothetical protein